MSENTKMAKCAVCGQEIAKSAKTCPHCGAKNKKPVYKRWWFWVIAVIVFIIIITPKNNNSGTPPASQSTSAVNSSAPSQKPTNSSAPQKNTKEYISVTATELSEAYKANEVAADKKYKGQWLTVTGTVDSIGVTLGDTYVILANDKDDWAIVNLIQCTVTEDTIDAVAELSKGDVITLQGKCSGLSFYVSVDNCIIIPN
ncbi:MAG: hypothetical protein LBN26_08670 [Christensenellaceae bacterium]|jgi:hypothetical protein|nr:hypothetical protein [Christensenellaceae bacterium]